MHWAEKTARRFGRFLIGVFLGFTILMTTAVSGVVAMVHWPIDYGPIAAIVSGCVVSGLFYLLILWAYKLPSVPKKKKDTELEGTDAD